MSEDSLNLSENSRLQLQTHCVLRDDLVCFNKLTGEVITLNHTGYLFLKLLNGKRSVVEIATCLAGNFRDDIKAVISDGMEFYAKMIDSDIAKLNKDE